MINRLLILLFFNCIVNTFLCSQSPSWEWVKHIGGISSEDANAVTTDKNGNIIIAGHFQSQPLYIENITSITTDMEGNIIAVKRMHK